MEFNSAFKVLTRQHEAEKITSPTQKTFYSNIYPKRCNVTRFILSGNCSTCFGWYHHPCAPDDGWWYHPKHVEQFADKVNCVTLFLIGYILEYSYDARAHER